MDQDVSRRRLLATAGSVLSASVAGCALQAPEEISPTERSPESEDLGDFPDEFDTPEQRVDSPPSTSEQTAVYQQVVDSVAAVEVRTPQGPAGGSAWVYDDSYLVTNDHVVALADSTYVRFRDVGWREASIVGSDPHSDLAVLNVENKPDSATSLSLVDGPKAVGTPVAAIGNPYELSGSFSTGVISGQDRNIQVPGRDFSIADGIQTDAAVNPGNSGGPLVTYDGEVVGVVSAGRGQTIGFAISAAMVDRVVPELIDDGEFDHSYMGIRLLDVRPALIEANDLSVSWGVYVHRIANNGPSDGVLQGTDEQRNVNGRSVLVGGDVIVRMDDWPIPNQERLSAFLALETDPGDTIEVEVVRDGERRTVPLTLGTRPPVENRPQ
ncbi:serine protease, S1-C subfamily, contains C-terminal PDZ domain [Halovenus aranensis]|uniref:Serine protease, S1-C subfamily, contains C-terminal PDZ domain n=1 Tax=Halovenus aranensis TaxID=890420 RepID=A0A1G8TSC0_9EURY|nr:trypsin-like peptidase domain-containing protein [Halovenus aranensis]SDJ44304.1 serine protease, S1-C subfamily, contains C-terminal PDZ domain [Halovenus aranensis]